MYRNDFPYMAMSNSFPNLLWKDTHPETRDLPEHVGAMWSRLTCCLPDVLDMDAKCQPAAHTEKEEVA